MTGDDMTSSLQLLTSSRRRIDAAIMILEQTGVTRADLDDAVALLGMAREDSFEGVAGVQASLILRRPAPPMRVVES